MRSPIGPILIVLGLATTAVLVLLLFQSIGVRTDLDQARAEVATLRGELEAQQSGVTDQQLVRRLDELESGIRDWLIATGADGGFSDDPPSGVGPPNNEVTDRLDRILERVEALDRRIDEICERVPVC